MLEWELGVKRVTEMDLLFQLYGDPVTESTFSLPATIRSWLGVEAALAGALGDTGIVSAAQADSISAACTLENVDPSRLWEETRVVGYPILPLVRMICRALPDEEAAFVHWGTTTQDIMDTALVLQVSTTMRRLDELAGEFGDALADLVEAHRGTVMAARTHGQQAVPTTFGAKCAVFLDQVARDVVRLEHDAKSAAVVSLFGAGGTSAALGSSAPAVRAALAARLGLEDSVVPWHVARDRLVEVGHTVTLASQTAVRFAREVIDLSRTEVGELAEGDGEYQGASSAMPQKANPVIAEAIVGFGVAAGTMSSALLRAAEAGQERAAGEWQVEWQALPYVLRSSAGALRLAAQLAKDLRVFPERMLENLALDNGLILAEAYMTRLAPVLGREKAHEVMYQASRQSRKQGRLLPDILTDLLDNETLRVLGDLPIQPEQYVGEVDATCTESLALWRKCRTAALYTAVDDERRR